MNWNPTRLHAFFLILVLALGGCSHLSSQDDHAPVVTMTDLTMGAVGLLAQEYQIELEIQNPSPKPLSVAGMNYALKLNGRAFARGVSRPEVKIPPFGKQRIQVAMTSNAIRVVEQFRQFNQKRFAYELTGSLYPEGSLIPLPFATRDEVRFAD